MQPVAYARDPSCESALQPDVIPFVENLKAHIAHPEVPDLDAVRICRTAPFNSYVKLSASDGLSDPRLEEARFRSLFPDFKSLSDARLRNQLNLLPGSKLMSETELRNYIANNYEFNHELSVGPSDLISPLNRTVSDDSLHLATIKHIEKMWPHLLKTAKLERGSSLLPTPFPFFIAAGRFTEWYYWDTYFAVEALLLQGRLELAQMQVENLLEQIRRYGFIPNGGRDYYLSRSQPPMISSMVKRIYEASVQAGQNENATRWLRLRALPLLKSDYEKFWMNPATRFDKESGLNHHWDAFDLPRPERHSLDRDEDLGRSYRDVRAGAESGLDFTDSYLGEASQVAGVLLNAMLFKTENDLAWMSEEIGEIEESTKFRRAAELRSHRMNTLMWNPDRGRYENYHLKRKSRIEILSAENTFALMAGLPSPLQANQIREALIELETDGGLMATELLNSHHQWDGQNAWAPYHFAAVKGYLNYSLHRDAERIGKKFVELVTEVFEKHGAIYERMDPVKRDRPQIDAHKYPVQEGFLWTNSVFLWILLEGLPAAQGQ